MKNPESKPLRIVSKQETAKEDSYIAPAWHSQKICDYALMLSNLAIAESNLVMAGKDSALPHFIAIVKELERVYGFKFEIMSE